MANPDSTFPIRVKPYKFDVSQFGDKTVSSREFLIENVSETDLNISLVDMPQGMFTIKLPKQIKAGQTEKGILTLNDDYLDKEFEKSLTIELSDEVKTRFTIPVKRTLRVPGGNAASKASVDNPPDKSATQSNH